MALIIAGQTTISIDTVYQRVLALANKEQRGYITPQEFNLHANQAQLDIFEQYFYDLATMVNMNKRAEAPQTNPGANNPLEPDFGDAVNILREKISKPFARKIQILTVGEQRAKVMGKRKVAAIFKKGKEAIRNAKSNTRSTKA